MDQVPPPVRPRQVEIAVGLLLAALAISAADLAWFWRPPQFSIPAAETFALLLIVVNVAFGAVYLALLNARRWALIVTVAMFIVADPPSFAELLWRGALPNGNSLVFLSGFVVRFTAIALLLTRASRRWFRDARTAEFTDSGGTLPLDGAWRDATPRP